MQLILGMGRTGLSVASFFAKQKIDFIMADDVKKPKLYQDCLLNKPKAIYCNTQVCLDGISQAIVSPGVASNHPLLSKLVQKNIPIISDIDVFSQYANAPIVGITGSNGKSTVVHLLTKIATDANIKAVLCGNVGIPVLDVLSDEVELYVLELSSYQLDYLQHIDLIAAVVLNISADHLDRYKNFAAYIQSKLSIYLYAKQNITPNDETHINPNDNDITYGLDIPQYPNQFGTVVCHKMRYICQGNESLFSIDEIHLLGLHNVSNILACLCLGTSLGIKTADMVKSIKTFQPIEHRLEYVGLTNDIYYYNDSKSTNVQSSIAALNAIHNKYPYSDVVLLIGGIVKLEDYQPLASLALKICTHIVIYGQDKDTLSKVFDDKTTLCSNLVSATDVAQSLIKQGIILLSPACVSFDEFNNFEHRGEVFKQLVT